jgi:hypothetical protein
LVNVKREEKISAMREKEREREMVIGYYKF